jgi:hypothetical protein
MSRHMPYLTVFAFVLVCPRTRITLKQRPSDSIRFIWTAINLRNLLNLKFLHMHKVTWRSIFHISLLVSSNCAPRSIEQLTKCSTLVNTSVYSSCRFVLRFNTNILNYVYTFLCVLRMVLITNSNCPAAQNLNIILPNGTTVPVAARSKT